MSTASSLLPDKSETAQLINLYLYTKLEYSEQLLSQNAVGDTNTWTVPSAIGIPRTATLPTKRELKTIMDHLQRKIARSIGCGDCEVEEALETYGRRQIFDMVASVREDAEKKALDAVKEVEKAIAVTDGRVGVILDGLRDAGYMSSQKRKVDAEVLLRRVEEVAESCRRLKAEVDDDDKSE